MDRPAVRQSNLGEAAPIHVDQAASAAGRDRGQSGRFEGFGHVDSDNRTLADSHLGAGLAEGIDGRGDDLGIGHDSRVGRGHPADVRFEQDASAANLGEVDRSECRAGVFIGPQPAGHRDGRARAGRAKWVGCQEKVACVFHDWEPRRAWAFCAAFRPV